MLVLPGRTDIKDRLTETLDRELARPMKRHAGVIGKVRSNLGGPCIPFQLSLHSWSAAKCLVAEMLDKRGGPGVIGSELSHIDGGALVVKAGGVVEYFDVEWPPRKPSFTENEMRNVDPWFEFWPSGLSVLQQQMEVARSQPTSAQIVIRKQLCIEIPLSPKTAQILASAKFGRYEAHLLGRDFKSSSLTHLEGCRFGIAQEADLLRIVVVEPETALRVSGAAEVGKYLWIFQPKIFSALVRLELPTTDRVETNALISVSEPESVMISMREDRDITVDEAIADEAVKSGWWSISMHRPWAFARWSGQTEAVDETV